MAQWKQQHVSTKFCYVLVQNALETLKLLKVSLAEHKMGINQVNLLVLCFKSGVTYFVEAKFFVQATMCKTA
jgi:hypothetical protein